MKTSLRFLSLALFTVLSNQAFAQCSGGQIAVSMNVYTDPWPYETYWELAPAGVGCGNGSIDSGANSNVGCAGVASGNSADGYAENTMYIEGDYCMTPGDMIDLFFVDTYGDGGLVFEIYEDGGLTHVYTGSGFGNTWTFEVGNSNLPAYDSPCGALNLPMDGSSVTVNNETAVAGYNELSPGAGDCSVYGYWCEGNSTNSVWLTFTAPDGMGNYEITTCDPLNFVDTQIALWKGSDCQNMSTFELVSANDDMFGGCSFNTGYASLIYTGCLEAGATYYLQVDGWEGAVGDIAVSMSPVNVSSSLDAQVFDTPCPLDKTSTPNGHIRPFVLGSSADFSCVWTGPNGYTSTENEILGLELGTYQLTLTTTCGQTFTGTYTVGEPEQWQVDSSVNFPDCVNSTNGSVNVSVAGATPDYTYTWGGPAGFAAASQDVNGLQAGLYLLTITDARGCTFQNEFSLQPLDDLQLDLGNDTVVCRNVVFPVQAPEGYNYLWQDESTNSYFVIDAQSWGLGTHYLILTMSTDDGCVETDVYGFVVDDCVGVEEVEWNAGSVYPNPSSGSFTIEWPSRSKAQIMLFDNSGKRVFVQATNEESTRMTVDTQLPSGFYVMKISTDGGVAHKNVVIE